MSKPDTPNRPTPFEIAREALAHVGKFNTPPTPRVYEVWYRYVEGVDEIIANLSHAVEGASCVSVDMLDELHKQYCTNLDESNDHVSDTLSTEMSSLQSILEIQMDAGRQFGSEIDEACGSLQHSQPTAESLAEVAKKMLSSNESMQQLVQQLQTQLQESQTKVNVLQNELHDAQKAVMTDPLTGLGNRRHFDLTIRRCLQSLETSGSQSFLLLADLDHFKYINDTFGHDCGDKVIMYVASQLRKLCPDASVSRLGGDEFAIVLSIDDCAEATETASAIRLYFASTPLKLSETGEDLGKIELSIGGARLRADDDAKSWFIRADKLLYQAKTSGRNSVMLEHRRD